MLASERGSAVSLRIEILKFRLCSISCCLFAVVMVNMISYPFSGFCVVCIG